MTLTRLPTPNTRVHATRPLGDQHECHTHTHIRYVPSSVAPGRSVLYISGQAELVHASRLRHTAAALARQAAGAAASWAPSRLSIKNSYE